MKRLKQGSVEPVLKNYLKIFLIHIGMSVLLPSFVSLVLFFIKPFYVNAHFLANLYFLSCSILMFIFPFRFSIYFDVGFLILNRLLFIFFFSFLHRVNKKIGIAFEIIFIVINILFGLVTLFGMGLV